MIHRAIAAALLVGLGLPAFAGQFASPTMEQAQGLANGRTQPNAVFDNNTAAGATQTQVSGALTTGGLSVPDSAVPPTASPSRPDLTVAPVPAPDAPPAHAKFFSSHSLMFGAGGAVIGATAGWLGGGPLGALIGALLGFVIGFAISKIMH